MGVKASSDANYVVNVVSAKEFAAYMRRHRDELVAVILRGVSRGKEKGK